MLATKFQLTLGLVKPHLIQNPVMLLKVQDQIRANNFFIIRSKFFFVDSKLAAEFYREHDGKFYFERLTSLMKSGASQALILGRDNAIVEWRKLLGPTKVLKAIYSHPDSLRAQFGLTDTRNALHGADSPEAVKREINLVFPEFDFQEFETQEKPYFLENRNIKFDDDTFVHKIVNDSKVG